MADPNALAGDLRQVVGRLVRRLRAERGDLSLSQAVVLGRLDRHGPAGISDLAAGERVRPQSMAATVAALHGAGLVERRPDPSDHRRVLIELTATGRERIATERRRREDWLEGAIRRDLNVAERRQLQDAIELLSRLAGGGGDRR